MHVQFSSALDVVVMQKVMKSLFLFQMIETCASAFPKKSDSIHLPVVNGVHHLRSSMEEVHKDI